MADVKISALPAATTPLAGTEVLPIVQSSTTKQVAVSDLTAGRAMSASSLTLTTPLSVANGGTGLNSLTASRIPYASATNTVGTSANLTFDGGSLYVGQGGSNQVVATNDGSLEIARAAGGPYIDMKAATASDYDCRIQSVGSGSTAYLQIKTGQGTGSFDFSYSGNLGLGVTPSAWGSFSKAFESAGGFGTYLTNANSNAAGLVSNAYRTNANWIYKTTDVASVYETYGGAHYWRTAPSGTAGNAISFTQAMTLDASGQLIIGGASGSEKLHIYGNIQLQTTSKIQFYNSGYFIKAQNGLEIASADYINFQTNGTTPAARIDASGNLLVGTASQVNGEKLGVSQPNNNNGLIVDCSNASFTNTAIVARCTRTTTNNTYKAYVLNNVTSGDLFYVTDGGRVYGTGAYVDLSDVRHKENIRAIDVGLETVLSLKPRRFDWREGKGDGQKNKLGFIAQEIAQVLPDVVTDWKTGDEALKGIAFAEIIPVLTKAIQELAAKVSALEARI